MNHNFHLSGRSAPLAINLDLDTYDIQKLDKGKEVYKDYFTPNDHYFVTVQKVEDDFDLDIE